jgi:RNA ligase (TIGR02306 family)
MEEIKKSTSKVEVLPITLEKHPNADNLSIARIFGYTCVVNTQQWQGIGHAAYIPPDNTVDVSRPEFSFLVKDAKSNGRARIKAKKIRGIISFGLLVPAPLDSVPGQDVSELLGVEHYEPPIPGTSKNDRGGLQLGGEVVSPPDLPFAVPKYDIDAFRRYAQLVFHEGEPVIVTEKIHGANARYVYHNGQMYCGSRTEWKKEFPDYSHITIPFLVENLKKKKGIESEEAAEAMAHEILGKLHSSQRKQNMWWQALDATPGLKEFCMANPGIVIYGEVYGAVKDLNYGHEKGKVSFAAFDLLQDGKWVDFGEAYTKLFHSKVPYVPVLINNVDESNVFPYNFDKLCEMAEMKSLVPGANHIAEGVVVKPLEERWDDRIGRVQLKIVSGAYLERSK